MLHQTALNESPNVELTTDAQFQLREEHFLPFNLMTFFFKKTYFKLL